MVLEGVSGAVSVSIDEYRQAEAASMSEAQLQTRVIKMAREAGWLCYHAWSSQHSAAGFPDLFMVKGDQIIAVELKRQDERKGKVSEHQWMWLDALAAAGVYAVVWRPEHLVSGVVAAVLSGERRTA